MTFCNNSNYWRYLHETWNMCSLSQNHNLYYQGRQFKMHFFLRIMPFFNLEKLWPLVISLLLLKKFTWNSEYVFAIQRAIHTIKEDNSKCIFSELCPFFNLHFLFSIKYSTAAHWHPHAVLLYLLLTEPENFDIARDKYTFVWSIRNSMTEFWQSTRVTIKTCGNNSFNSL